MTAFSLFLVKLQPQGTTPKEIFFSDTSISDLRHLLLHHHLRRLASSPAIRIYPPRLYEVEKTSIHNKSYLNDQEDEDVLFSGVASGSAGVSCSPYADYTKKE
ncbi:hypothetical protein F2Q69_00021522 [Brassica cretica]|uniref:Uncharacterized protein n=1 Tax=Brassica cretica TaxID=69181 RepID=A0A8S9Q2S4_BRACR|nr:hypothetical protein F2Q69_00021522 [Brassica cretica]